MKENFSIIESFSSENDVVSFWGKFNGVDVVIISKRFDFEISDMVISMDKVFDLGVGLVFEVVMGIC